MTENMVSMDDNIVYFIIFFINIIIIIILITILSNLRESDIFAIVIEILDLGK